MMQARLQGMGRAAEVQMKWWRMEQSVEMMLYQEMLLLMCEPVTMKARTGPVSRQAHQPQS